MITIYRQSALLEVTRNTAFAEQYCNEHQVKLKSSIIKTPLTLAQLKVLHTAGWAGQRWCVQ